MTCELEARKVAGGGGEGEGDCEQDLKMTSRNRHSIAQGAVVTAFLSKTAANCRCSGE